MKVKERKGKERKVRIEKEKKLWFESNMISIKVVNIF